MQPRQLGPIEQVGLPFEGGNGSRDGHAAHGHADQVPDQDASVRHVDRHPHHGLDVFDEAFPVVAFGRAECIDGEHPGHAAGLGQVRKQDAEHGKPRGVIARLDQVAHLLLGVGAKEPCVVASEFARGGEPEHGSRGSGAKRGERGLMLGPLDPRYGHAPRGHAGVRRFTDGHGAFGIALRVLGGKAEREERASIQRPCIVLGRRGRGKSVAQGGQGVHLDHRSLEAQVCGERRVQQHGARDREARDAKRLSERAVERAALGDRGSAQFACGGLGVTEGCEGLGRRAARCNGLGEVRAELTLDVDALGATELGHARDTLRERGELRVERALRARRVRRVRRSTHAHASMPAGRHRVSPSAPMAVVRRCQVAASVASRFVPSGVSR